MKKIGLIKEYSFTNSKELESLNLLKNMLSGIVITSPNNITISDELSLYSKELTFDTQTSYELNTFTKWKTECYFLDLLKNYLLNKLSDSGLFDNICNYLQLDKNSFILEFIDVNIIKNYKLSSIDIYTNYYDVTNITQDIIYSKDLLVYNITKNILLRSPFLVQETYNNIPIIGYNKENINYLIKDNIVEIKFTQSKLSTRYIFGYYIKYNFEII